MKGSAFSLSVSWIRRTSRLEHVFIRETVSVCAICLSAASLPSQFTPHPKPYSTPQLGQLLQAFTLRSSVLRGLSQCPQNGLETFLWVSPSPPTLSPYCSISLPLLWLPFLFWIISSLWSEFRHYFLAQLTKPLRIWALPTSSLRRLLTSPLFSVHWVWPPFCSASTLRQSGSTWYTQ